MPRLIISGFDLEDGTEPRMTLSRDNPFRVPDLSDAEGHELHTLYQLGGDLPDGDRDAAPLSPFHSQGVPQ